jgi:phage/plasmid-associated DNA primase
MEQQTLSPATTTDHTKTEAQPGPATDPSLADEVKKHVTVQPAEPLDEWLRAQTQEQSQSSEHEIALYSDYARWCRLEGHRSRDVREWSAALRERGYRYARRRYHGLSLIDERSRELARLDALNQFLTARTSPDDGAAVPALALYDAYEEWCRERDLITVTAADFERRLTSYGLEYSTSLYHGLMVYGLYLVEE